ncbi:MAG: tetratricopeptide repeat protein [Chloroflexi bacterium]|nr:tetratricopeptide repeat protein [Chloroflexota bacterium]
MTTYAIGQPIRPELDEDYQKALQHLQSGQWSQAIQILKKLQERYPQHRELQDLLEHAQLKAKLEQEHPTPKRFLIPPWLQSWWRRGAVAILALIAVLITVQVYTRVIVPMQAQQAQVVEYTRLLEEGQQALAIGAYERAADIFRRLLEEVPDSVPAREGLAIAEERLALRDQYQAAVALQEEGKVEEALQAFRELQQKSPGYADVPQRIKALERQLEVQRYYEEATRAYQEGRWEEAVAAYEAVRNLDVDFRQEEVTERLFESYRHLAQALLSQPDESGENARQALELLSKALSLRPRDAQTSAERALVYDYLQGREAVEAQRWDEAARYLEPIYERSPDFMAGAVVPLLYRVYLEQGKQYEARGEYPQALERYRLASMLPIADTSEARQRMNAIAPLATPSPTPTPTPEPTPTPTPTPTPLPLSAYRGWIAFKTDRDGGVSIYVMRPDGSDQRPVSDPETYEKLEEREAYSPDGTRRVYNEGDSHSTPLYIWRYDVPPTWERRRQLLDNSSINYQPAWSPQGNLIAFVSQVTGNDEIWVISADEREEHPTPKQLTFNTWEWDKHPTWSPDSQYIAFWSNRETGRRQIWVMRADGSNQVNISRNEYNDWDPVWIK